jgi:hypothetical protein
MTSKRDFGQFLKTSGSTANWYFEFQDGKMDMRTEKEAGFAGFGSKSGKSNVLRKQPIYLPADAADESRAFKSF